MSTAGLANIASCLKMRFLLLHGTLAVSGLSELRFRSDKLYEPSNKSLGRSQTRNASKRIQTQQSTASWAFREELSGAVARSAHSPRTSKKDNIWRLNLRA